MDDRTFQAGFSIAAAVSMSPQRGGAPVASGSRRGWAGGLGHALVGRRAAAFSLFELVTVLAILSIVAGMAVPRFSGADRRYRADAAAQRVVADLQYVSRTARARSASAALTFSTTTDSYVSSAKPLGGRLDEPYVVRLDQPPYRAALLQVELDGDDTGLTFDGYGWPDRSGRITLAVGSLIRTVIIDAETRAFMIE